MSQEPSCEVEVAVLKQQVSDLKEIVLKLEEAIERINDVNLNVIKMLAAHEERIIHNEQNDQNLFAKIVELEVKINTNKEDLTKEIIGIRTKIIPIVTAVVIAGFIISNSEFFGKLLHNENDKKSLLTNPPLYGRIV
jgi:hypothetical protein